MRPLCLFLGSRCIKFQMSNRDCDWARVLKRPIHVQYKTCKELHKAFLISGRPTKPPMSATWVWFPRKAIPNLNHQNLFLEESPFFIYPKHVCQVLSSFGLIAFCSSSFCSCIYRLYVRHRGRIYLYVSYLKTSRPEYFYGSLLQNIQWCKNIKIMHQLIFLCLFLFDFAYSWSPIGIRWRPRKERGTSTVVWEKLWSLGFGSKNRARRHFFLERWWGELKDKITITRTFDF